jgi:hypothetical protein
LQDVVRFLGYALNISGFKNHSVSLLITCLVFLSVLATLKLTVYKKATGADLKDFFQTSRKKEWLLLLAATTPLIVLGLFRSIYPDQNFDTFHFELYLQEFDFSDNKTNFAAGAIRTYYFPIAERIFALCRHLLGYRAGALFNTFLLVAVVASAYDFIKKFIGVYAKDVKVPLFLPALLALLVVFADNTLATVGSYKPDLIGVPLLLELVHMIAFGGKRSKKFNYVVFCLLASLIIAYKLTYLPYVAILMLVYFIKSMNNIKPLALLLIPVVILAFPSVYMLYNVMETGSPLFPFFNKYLHSPLYPLENFKDTRWGPHNLYETCFFHIVTFLDNNRCNEWSLFSYRLLFGFFISIAAIVVFAVRYKKTEKVLLLKAVAMLAVLALLFDYACIVTTGYYRYGMIVEVLYGLTAALLLLYLQKSIWSLVIIAALLFQAGHTFRNMYVRQMNLSWHDYRSLLHEKERRQRNLSRIFNDYGNVADPDHILPKVDAFVGMAPGVFDGLGRMLSNKAVLYDLSDSRIPGLVQQYEKLVRSESAIKNIMVLANIAAVQDGAVNYISNKGYEVTGMYEVYPDFMRADEPVFLFKIKAVDTGRYTIKTAMHFFNVDAVQSNFRYRPAGTMKAFIREVPYTFDWYPKAAHELFINDKKYNINDKLTGNKILTVETDSLAIRTSVPVPYLIITQEIIEKK